MTWLILLTAVLMLTGCAAKCKPVEIQPPQKVWRCSSEFWLVNGRPIACPPATSYCRCTEDL